MHQAVAAGLCGQACECCRWKATPASFRPPLSTVTSEVIASADSNSWDAGWISLVVLSTLAALLVATCLAYAVWRGAQGGFTDEVPGLDDSPGSSKMTSATSQRSVPEAWVESDANSTPGAHKDKDDYDPFEQPPVIEAERPRHRNNSRRRSNASVGSRVTEDGNSNPRVRSTASSRRRHAAAAATAAFATADDGESPGPADDARRRSHQTPGPEAKRAASSDDAVPRTGASSTSAGAGRQRANTVPPNRSGCGTPPRGKKAGDSEEPVPPSNDQQRGTRAADPTDSSSAQADNTKDASADVGPGASETNNVSEEELSSIVARLNSELDTTRAKDVEWRRRHFKGLLLRWHPDKNRERPELAAEVLKHLLARRSGYLDS